jgi:hypothetical protein
MKHSALEIPCGVVNFSPLRSVGVGTLPRVGRIWVHTELDENWSQRVPLLLPKESSHKYFEDSPSIHEQKVVRSTHQQTRRDSSDSKPPSQAHKTAPAVAFLLRHTRVTWKLKIVRPATK